MNPERSPEELQNDLIEYHFSYPDILKKALTRRSWLEETGCSLKEREDNMYPLATLGDAVLDLIVIEMLYENGERNIGNLTESKIEDIRKAKTQAIAESYSYEKYVWWGTGEAMNEIWRTGEETFDTCMEALIGAVYLDARKSGKDPIKCVIHILSKLGFKSF